MEVVFTEGRLKNIYEFTLRPTDEDGFLFEREATYFWDTQAYEKPYFDESWTGHTKARVT